MIVLPEFMCIHTYISPPLSVYVCATSFYAVAAKGPNTFININININQ